MVKLKDIAEYLNISVSTVSRVVNNQDHVDPIKCNQVSQRIILEHTLQTSNTVRQLAACNMPRHKL